MSVSTVSPWNSTNRVITTLPERLNFGRLLRNPVLALAFGFGAGLFPRAPGTVGTLLALPIWYACSGWSTTAYLALVCLLAAVGVLICHRATQILGVHDHPGIVFDEIVGYLLALAVVPRSFLWLAVSFIVFRFFDIVKPWPIGTLDRRVGGGLGVMLDDLVAGLMTAIVVLLLVRAIPLF